MHVARRQRALPAEPDRVAFHLNLDPERPQHILAMIPAPRRLDHLDRAIRAQPREQDRRLDLRRRLFVDEPKPVQIAAMDRHREPIACRRLDPRAHLAQRPEHAPHRPPAQALVTGEGDRNREPRRRPHQQPRAGPAIAAIDGLGRARPLAPLDPPFTRPGPLDTRPQCRHRACRVQHILALEQPVDLGRPLGQRAEDQRAVRH